MFQSSTAWMLLAAVCAPALAAGDKSALDLIEHGTAAMRANPDESKQDAEHALDMIRRHPDADLEIRARLLLCDYYSERDADAARQKIDGANALLPQARRQALRAGVPPCQGETLESAGKTPHAMTDFDAAVSVATAANEEQMLAEALFSRGYLRALQGEYAAGMADARRSHELFDRRNMPQHALTVLSTIATIYNRMGEFDQAARIYEQVQSQQHDAGLRRDEAVSLYNLGKAHQKLGEWDAARTGFSRCLALSQELKYPRGEAYALLGLAAVDDATGDPNGALGTLARAAELQRQTPDSRLNAHIQLVRGTALRKLQRGAEALPALQQSEAVVKQANSLEEMGAADDELAIVHAQLGDWQSAYQYRSEAQAAAGKLLHNQLDQRFSALKVEFDTAAKDKENALLLGRSAADQKALAQERRANTLQMIVIVLSLMLLSLLTILVLYQRRGARHMRALAMTDELTGAPNRRAVLAHLAAQLERGDAQVCSILIIDIDYFKSINDLHGHPIGDVTLQHFTMKLRNAIAEPAFFGRLGGEEFVVVVPDTDLDGAHLLAEQIRLLVPSIDLSRWLGVRRITVSIGVTASTAADTVSTMLRRADAALYTAKHAGRNCVRTDLAADVEVPTVWCETSTATL